MITIKEALCYIVLLPVAAVAMHTGMAAAGAPTREACATRVAHANTQLAVYGQAPSLSVERECY